MPPTPDLSVIGLDEFVNKHVVGNSKAKSSEEEPKEVRKHDDVLIIKEWVSDDEEEDVSQPKIEKKIVKPSIIKKEFVKSKQQEKIARKTVKQNLVPRAVLMKSGLVSINTARQNISKTAVLVNTVRQVNAAHLKTTVNVARPMSYLSKTAHSTVKMPIHKNTTFKNNNINQRVNIVRGKKFNTTKPKAVVNVVKENNVNAVKTSACWVNPQMDLQDQRVIDSGCSRHMTGNTSYLINYEEIDGGYVAFSGNPKGGKITGKVPQPSDPIKNVVNEAVHKELGDSLVRAATTASSLEAEQDSGNINKTQSKATPNESSSLGTTSGGGPRFQETIGDTIAQTRFKNVSKHSNDSLLARGVESSDNEESLGEDASKQGTIDAIDADEEITLEVFVAEQEVAANEKDDQVNVVEEVVEVINTAKLITDATTVSATTTTTDDDGDITLAQALIEIKSTKPKNKRVVIQEMGESTTTISSQQS
ncbi:hypothetical protein Tco_0403336 [Tanacetum coccineum]